MKQIKQQAFHLPIFHNNFDLTWMFMNDYKNKKEYTVLPIESAIDDGTVLYKYNKDGYRSDDFKSGSSILFAGCSQTEGVGSPIDTIWPTMLLDKLNDPNHYSIARSGYGWQSIIQNYLVYENRYGTPEHLFILLPNLARFYTWENDNWFYVQRYPGKPQKNKDRKPGVLEEKELTVEDHRRSFIDFCFGWKLFEEYCKSKNINLIWSTWDYEETENIVNSNVFNFYIPLTIQGYENYVQHARPDLNFKEHDLTRRDGHSGILEHEYWANAFFDFIQANLKP